MTLVKSKSSIVALFLNGYLPHIINPWIIIIDFENEIITVEKRNWYFIGSDKNEIAFRFIRNIRTDEHLFGANISIKATGGWVSAYYLPKLDVKNIKDLLFAYNKTKKSSMIFS